MSTETRFTESGNSPPSVQPGIKLCECGCGKGKQMRSIRDLKGQQFHRLQVLRCTGRDKRGRAVWLCRCVCGGEVEVQSGNLLSGNSTKCRNCGYTGSKKEHLRRVKAD